MQRLTRDDEGAVAVLVALVMVALLGFGVIVIDVGQVYAERRQLQNGADAAALSLAADCPSPTGCSTDTSVSGQAGTKADQNANDGSATVTEICGNAASLAPCAPASGLGPWDCRPVPTALTGADYVQVRTETRAPGGGSLLPAFLARALVPGYAGTNVRACARVSWGGAGALTSAVPLTISNCEFESIVGSPPTNFAPAPPYPPYPAASWERTFYLHDTTEASGSSCPAGPSGGDDPLSGGFGWLDSTDCKAYSSVDGTFPAKPGSSPGSDCRASQLDDLIGQLAYIPIYDYATGPSDGKAYGMRGFAAFVITGYNLGGAYKEPSVVSGSPGVYPCANDPTTGSQRCVSGFFTQALVPTSGVIGGPLLGAPPVIQMSG